MFLTLFTNSTVTPVLSYIVTERLFVFLLQLLPNLYHVGGASWVGASGLSFGPIQETLESMAGEVTRVVDEQLKVCAVSVILEREVARRAVCDSISYRSDFCGCNLYMCALTYPTGTGSNTGSVWTLCTNVGVTSYLMRASQTEKIDTLDGKIFKCTLQGAIDKQMMDFHLRDRKRRLF